MIKHYLKIAIRNLMKYKTQSVISILGLAVGFVCFALSALWIHYEMTYDSANKDADRMYVLYQKDVLNQSGYSTNSSYPISTLLKETFPEVEAACAFNRWTSTSASIETEEGNKASTPQLLADSCFMDMFRVSVLSGSMDFMYTNDKIALTKDIAMQLFGSTDVLGRKVIVNNEEQTVCAILDGLEHSNFQFGFWSEGAYFRQFMDDWSNYAYCTVIKLRKGTDPDAFQKKMREYADEKTDDHIESLKSYQLMPLTSYHYAFFNKEKTIGLNYLLFFSVIGLLVILCSLSNYLSLFVTRMNIRMREIGLRKVCGSSVWSLFCLFATEYLSVIFLSGFIGMMTVEIILPEFRHISMIQGNVYGEALVYFSGIAVFSLLLLIPFIKRNPHPSQKRRKNLIRKTGLFFQLFIGILFIFCTGILIKQLYYLSNVDLGWERKNIATFKNTYPMDYIEELANKIAQMSCTKEVMSGHLSLFPKGCAMSIKFDKWEGKQDSVPPINMECIAEGEEFIHFYGLKLLEGEMLKADDKKSMIINESAVKALGLTHPVGTTISNKNSSSVYTIIGVIKNFHTTPPTIPVPPIALVGKEFDGFQFDGTIIVKYHEGKWKELHTKVNELIEKEYPNFKSPLINVEEEYDTYLQAEHTLLKLLSFMAIICFLISIFGIFSFMSLTCEQRQKEIAIRKVNGATIQDILLIFVKEHFILLTISATFAFAIGYILMKHWLETYVKQTEINAWIFIGIYGAIAIIIAISIGWRVWKAANENPAEVIKNE